MFVTRKLRLRKPKKRLSDQEKYENLYKIQPNKPIIPELRTPTQFNKTNYPAPKFNPKTEKIITNPKELTLFNKVESEITWPKPIWDLQKIVDFLKDHRIDDICVIRTDPVRGGTDFMVIASGLSKRHISIVGEELHSQYKNDLREAYLEDSLARFEGILQDEDNMAASFPNSDARNEKILSQLEARTTIEGARGRSDWVAINLLSSVIHLLTDFSRKNLLLEELHLLNHHDPHSTSMKDDKDFQEQINKQVYNLTHNSTDPEEVYDSLAEEYMTDTNKLRNEEELTSSYATNINLQKSGMGDDSLIGLNLEDFSENQDIEAIRQEILEEFQIEDELYSRKDLVRDFDLADERDYKEGLKMLDDFLNNQNKNEGKSNSQSNNHRDLKNVTDYALNDKNNYFDYRIEGLDGENGSENSTDKLMSELTNKKGLTAGDKLLLKKMKSEQDEKSREDSAKQLLDDL